MNRRNRSSNMPPYQPDSHQSSSVSQFSQFSPGQHPSISILHKMTQAQRKKNGTKMQNDYHYDQHSTLTSGEDDGNDEYDREEGEVEKLSEAVQALIIKNKLNLKNAFDVPLIDVSTLQVIKNNDDTSWNKISSVLQNSSKVYGLRVDFMTDSLNKMTNNINRNEQTNDQSGDAFEKKQQSELQEIDYDQYSSPNHSFKLKEVYDKHLQKGENKMIEENVCNKANHSQLQIRRMFDQSGISGLLLARMPITSNLNVSIDPSISYPRSISQMDQIIDFQLPYFTHLSIFQQINKFQTHCFPQPKKDQFELDCYNVDFQQGIEVFRSALDEEDNLMDMFEEKNDEVDTFQIENPQFQRCSNYFESNRSSMQTSNSNPFSSLFDESKILKNKKKKGNLGSKKPKQKKGQSAKQEILIDFGQKFVKKTKEEVFLTNLDNKNRKQKKLNEKNVFKIVIPPFLLHYENSLTPPRSSQNTQPITHQHQLENHKNEMSYYQRDEQLSVLMEGFTGMYTSQNSTAMAMTNIKTTKLRLFEYIRGQTQISFDQMYSDYEMKFGSSSEAILFLSVLHLCNQNNLSLFPQGQFDLIINNPTPLQQ